MDQKLRYNQLAIQPLLWSYPNDFTFSAPVQMCHWMRSRARSHVGCVRRGYAITARQPLVNGRIDETQLVTLRGNVRPEATASHDLGQVADSMPMNHLQLVLVRPSGMEAALEDYMRAAQTPGSPNYHAWLTAEEIGAKYGPDSQDIAAVRGWLELHGLHVNSVSVTGMMIDFSGTAGEVAETFKSEIHSLDVNGERHMANMQNPQIPAALAAVVAGITSLNDFRPRPMMKPVRTSTAVAPTRDATKPAYTVNSGYQVVAPADLETIYNFNPVYKSGVTGKGETVIVIEDTDLYSVQDYATFRKTFGLDSYKHSWFSVVHPGGCTDPGVVVGADFEATIDAEWATAAAPDANIVLASCADTTDNFGGFIALQGLVDSHTPPAIVSISYGVCEASLGAAFNRYINVLYQQAAAEGMSVYVAAGDEGAASCDAGGTAAISGISVSGSRPHLTTLPPGAPISRTLIRAPTASIGARQIRAPTVRRSRIFPRCHGTIPAPTGRCSLTLAMKRPMGPQAFATQPLGRRISLKWLGGAVGLAAAHTAKPVQIQAHRR